MQCSDYKRLKVWQKAMDLTTEIYRLVRFLPKEEMYALSDQLRRAAVSIPSNIAEGHGRQSDKEMVKFLYIARGSLYEVETQLQICVRMSFLHEDSIKSAKDLIDEIGKMIRSLISYRQNLTPNT